MLPSYREGFGNVLVEAAYAVSRMKRAGSEGDYRTWLKNTVTAWENYRSRAPVNKEGKSEAQLPPYVDYAAEAEFTLLEEDIRGRYDSPERHKYAGAVADDAEEMRAFDLGPREQLLDVGLDDVFDEGKGLRWLFERRGFGVALV